MPYLPVDDRTPFYNELTSLLIKLQRMDVKDQKGALAYITMALPAWLIDESKDQSYFYRSTVIDAVLSGYRELLITRLDEYEAMKRRANGDV